MNFDAGSTQSPHCLTPLQQSVLDYCREYLGRNDQLPPSRTLQIRFGWNSQTMATQMMGKLARKGYLEKNENGKYRFRRTPCSME